MSKNILQSLLLDKAPWKWADFKDLQAWKDWKDGKQPAGSTPTFPEETKSETEKLPSEALDLLVKELNKIFHDTGFYPSRFMIVFLIVNIILLFVVLFIAVPIWICTLVLASISLCRVNKRKKTLARTLQEWNSSVGVDYGVHMEMGGKDGAGPDNCCCCYKEVFLHVCDGPGEDVKLGCCLL